MGEFRSASLARSSGVALGKGHAGGVNGDAPRISAPLDSIAFEDARRTPGRPLTMIRSAILALATSLALPLPAPAQAPKVLRYAFPIAETGFDPAQISDLYSRTIAANIFEAPLSYDYLARPFKLKPQ